MLLLLEYTCVECLFDDADVVHLLSLLFLIVPSSDLVQKQIKCQVKASLVIKLGVVLGINVKHVCYFVMEQVVVIYPEIIQMHCEDVSTSGRIPNII